MLSPGKDALGHATYERHRPEQTLLYQLVEKHYPALVEQLEFQGKSLPPQQNDTGGLRAGGFHCPSGGTGSQAQGQPHAIPWRSCP